MPARNPRQLATGRWQARYTGPDGREHSRTFDAKGAAVRFLTETRAQLAVGDWLDPRFARMTLRAWSGVWAPAQLSEWTTAKVRDGHLRNHVLPAFGDHPLGAITRTAVQAWVSRLAEGLAPATVAKAYQVLSSMLSAAVDEGLLRASPCRRIALPRVHRAERAFVTREQVTALLPFLPERYRALVVLAYTSGLRWSELAGLRRRRLDLSAGRCDVVEVAKESAGRIAFGTPKSRTSTRTVELDPATCRVLATHLERFPPPGGSDLVFTGPRGATLSRTRFRARVWLPALRAAGLDRLRPAPTFHSLRHGHAAALVADRWPMKAIQRRLGHASIRITLDLYGHLEEQLAADLLASLAERLAGIDVYDDAALLGIGDHIPDGWA